MSLSLSHTHTQLACDVYIRVLLTMKFLIYFSPVGARDDKYVTYTKKWRIPKDTKPGSYAVDFVERVQFRRTQITATETVKINVVD